MSVIRMVVMAFTIVVGLIGCATAPSNIGFGRFMKVYTPSGNLVQQATFKSDIDCEINVRGAWKTEPAPV